MCVCARVRLCVHLCVCVRERASERQGGNLEDDADGLRGEPLTAAPAAKGADAREEGWEQQRHRFCHHSVLSKIFRTFWAEFQVSCDVRAEFQVSCGVPGRSRGVVGAGASDCALRMRDTAWGRDKRQCV